MARTVHTMKSIPTTALPANSLFDWRRKWKSWEYQPWFIGWTDAN
jgi:hypothetical protein